MTVNLHNPKNQREESTISEYLAAVKTFEYPNGSHFEAETVYHALLARKQIIGKSYPDFYANYNGILWGFEHFEFDDTRNVNKRGSHFRRTNADIKRFKEAIDDPQVLLAGKSVILDHFVRYYIDNVMDIFTYHYERLNDYKRVLIEQNTQEGSIPIKIGFIIEDRNRNGSIYWDENLEHLPDGPPPPENYLSLLRCDEFLDFFKSRKLIDFILFMYTTPDRKKHIGYLDHKNILKYRKNQLCIKQIEASGIHYQDTQYISCGIAGPGCKEINETIPHELRDQVHSMRMPTQIIYPSKKK